MLALLVCLFDILATFTSWSLAFQCLPAIALWVTLYLCIEPLRPQFTGTVPDPKTPHKRLLRYYRRMQRKHRSKPCPLPLCLRPIRHHFRRPKPHFHLEQPDPRLNSQHCCFTTIATKTTLLSGLLLPNFAIPSSVFTAVPGIANPAALAL
jgi:hypothetical protein